MASFKDVLSRVGTVDLIKFLAVISIVVAIMAIIFQAVSLTTVSTILVALAFGAIVGLFLPSISSNISEVFKADPVYSILGVALVFAIIGLFAGSVSQFGQPFSILGSVSFLPSSTQTIIQNMLSKFIGFGLFGVVFGGGAWIGNEIREK